MSKIERNKKLHNQILISKLLQCRDGVSPVTLICDSLHQSGWPLILDMISKAKVNKTFIILVSFETLQKPTNVDTFISSHLLSPSQLQSKLLNTLSTLSSTTPAILIIDTLHPYLSLPNFNIASFLAPFLRPSLNLILLFHADIPLAPPKSSLVPPTLRMLRYLATAILITHSFSHILARKYADDRATAPALIGPEEGLGVLVALGSNGEMRNPKSLENIGGTKNTKSTVVEIEVRRKSGRVVREWIVVTHDQASGTSVRKTSGNIGAENVCLLDDHVLWPKIGTNDRNEWQADQKMESTFNLDLTDKEKKEREGIRLPYFDAQNDDGVGLGGRILYDMGAEDDFDDEEDEI